MTFTNKIRGIAASTKEKHFRTPRVYSAFFYSNAINSFFVCASISIQNIELSNCSMRELGCRFSRAPLRGASFAIPRRICRGSAPRPSFAAPADDHRGPPLSTHRKQTKIKLFGLTSACSFVEICRVQLVEMKRALAGRKRWNEKKNF